MTKKLKIIILLCSLLGIIVLLLNRHSTPGPYESPGSAAGDIRIIASEAGEILVEAQKASRQGDYERALALADEVDLRDRYVPETAFLRARIYSDLNRLEEAESEYMRALSLDSTMQGVWMNLGNNATRQTRYSIAIERFRKEFEHFPSSELLLRIGHALEELNEQDSARDAYRRAIALDDQHAAAYARLAQAHSRDGEYEIALEHMRDARTYDPDNHHYMYFTGFLLLQTGEVHESVQYLKTVANHWPWHSGARYSLGQAYTRLGDSDKAEQYLEHAEELRAIEANISLIMQRIELNPARGSLWADLAEGFRLLGRQDKALEAYTVALYYNPADIPVRNNIASLHLLNGRINDAIEHYRRIVEMNAELPEVWTNLGLAYMEAGEERMARESWERTLDIDPDHPVARRYLAATGH